MSKQSFEKQCRTNGLPVTLTNEAGVAMSVWDYCIEQVRLYSNFLTENGTGIFENYTLKDYLLNDFPTAPELPKDDDEADDICHDLALTFTFNFCQKIGHDYYLPEGW